MRVVDFIAMLNGDYGFIRVLSGLIVYRDIDDSKIALNDFVMACIVCFFGLILIMMVV